MIKDKQANEEQLPVKTPPPEKVEDVKSEKEKPSIELKRLTVTEHEGKVLYKDEEKKLKKS